jgi:Holliday junction resolvase RusA-like endonuclease
MAELRLTIPGNPPTGNHYKAFRTMPTANGKMVPSWYLTREAKDWHFTVAAIAAGRTIRADSYTVSILVFTPTARQTDTDNFFKCALDSLQHCGLIDDDKKVTDLHGYRRIDRANPRTVIIVKTEQGQMFGEVLK